MTDVRERAERRFEEALRTSGARDPREFYRSRLRSLKESDPEAFRKGLAYFEETLLPTVAREETDPLGAWMEYGRYLAGLSAEGETVQIDPGGRATPFGLPVDPAALILHLPRDSDLEALAVGLPPKLSEAQRAAYDLLVLRKID